MNQHKAWKSYRQVATETASSGQLVLMLFDGAIRFLEGAEAGFEHEDPAEFNEAIHNNVTKTQAIIHELNMALNMEEGGELSVHLRNIYDYMDFRLQQSNVQKEISGIQDVKRRIQILRDAWAAMLLSQGGSGVINEMAREAMT
jgi:flagellar secretion chaperone FliS